MSDFVRVATDSFLFPNNSPEVVKMMSDKMREELIVTSPSGTNRSSDNGKPRYDLVPLLLLRRCAIHMARNMESKGEANWRNACTQEDINRAMQSAFRHFIDWFEGKADEDHAAALMFNVGLAEEAKEKMNRGKEEAP